MSRTCVGEVRRHQVDVVGEVLPDAGRRRAPSPGRRACPRCRPRARRASPRRRSDESWSTIALTVVPMRRNSPSTGLPVDGEGHLLREVAVGDRVDHARDLGGRPDEVVDHPVDRVGRLAPGAAVARQRHALVEAPVRGRRARRAAARRPGSSAGRRGRCTRCASSPPRPPWPSLSRKSKSPPLAARRAASNSRSVASSTGPFAVRASVRLHRCDLGSCALRAGRLTRCQLRSFFRSWSARTGVGVSNVLALAAPFCPEHESLETTPDGSRPGSAPARGRTRALPRPRGRPTGGASLPERGRLPSGGASPSASERRRGSSRS